MDSQEEQFQARFGGIGRLLGQAGLERLRRAHVCVVGLGGVGSWAVEALARSGLGELTLIDLDDVCISNVNRQLHASDGEFGKPKVEVLDRRVRAINPFCQVHAVWGFFLKSNAGELLQTPFDFVLDAIDSPSLKAVLIAGCCQRGIPVMTTGAAGGRQDPLAIEITDLAFSSHDRLLQEVRGKLRRRHGFPRGDCPFGVECVLSREPIVRLEPTSACAEAAQDADLRLDCGNGLGTASFVTGAFGLAAASRIIRAIAGTLAAPKQTRGESSVPLEALKSPDHGPATLPQNDTPRPGSPDGSGPCPSPGPSADTQPALGAGTGLAHRFLSANVSGEPV